MGLCRFKDDPHDPEHTPTKERFVVEATFELWEVVVNFYACNLFVFLLHKSPVFKVDLVVALVRWRHQRVQTAKPHRAVWSGAADTKYGKVFKPPLQRVQTMCQWMRHALFVHRLHACAHQECDPCSPSPNIILQALQVLHGCATRWWTDSPSWDVTLASAIAPPDTGSTGGRLSADSQLALNFQKGFSFLTLKGIVSQEACVEGSLGSLRKTFLQELNIASSGNHPKEVIDSHQAKRAGDHSRAIQFLKDNVMCKEAEAPEAVGAPSRAREKVQPTEENQIFLAYTCLRAGLTGVDYETIADAAYKTDAVVPAIYASRRFYKQIQEVAAESLLKATCDAVRASPVLSLSCDEGPHGHLVIRTSYLDKDYLPRSTFWEMRFLAQKNHEALCEAILDSLTGASGRLLRSELGSKFLDCKDESGVEQKGQHMFVVTCASHPVCQLCLPFCVARVFLEACGAVRRWRHSKWCAKRREACEPTFHRW